MSLSLHTGKRLHCMNKYKTSNKTLSALAISLFFSICISTHYNFHFYIHCYRAEWFSTCPALPHRVISQGRTCQRLFTGAILWWVNQLFQHLEVMQLPLQIWVNHVWDFFIWSYDFHGRVVGLLLLIRDWRCGTDTYEMMSGVVPVRGVNQNNQIFQRVNKNKCCALTLCLAGSLSALVYQHTISQYALPCKLLLQFHGRILLNWSSKSFILCVCERKQTTKISHVLFKDVGAAEEKTNDKPASEEINRTGG